MQDHDEQQKFDHPGAAFISRNVSKSIQQIQIVAMAFPRSNPSVDFFLLGITISL